MGARDTQREELEGLVEALESRGFPFEETQSKSLQGSLPTVR